MEIERKYLLDTLPENLESFDSYLIEQGYINTFPVIRIRKKITKDQERYILTVKSSGLLSRQEYELDLTSEEYDTLSKKVEGNIITKRRYLIPLSAISDIEQTIDVSNLKLELDIFENKFKGLIMGEIEFPNEETADAYKMDSIFKEEVTFDKRFHNSQMSSMSSGDIADFIESLK